MTIRFAGSRQHWPAAVLGLAVLAACNGSTPTQATVPDASVVALSIVSGNTQKAPVNTKVAGPLRVRVLDHSGHPVPNFVVNFVVTSGGGSVFGGAEQTDAQGYAEDVWTLGPRLGPQTVDVRSVDAHTGQPVTYGHFTATGLPPHTIPIVFTSPRAQDSQSSIVMANADGSGEKVVSALDAVDDMQPALSPNRTTVVFTTSAFGNWDIMTMHLDGTARTRLAESGSDYEQSYNPQWSPDGSHIVFTSDINTPRGGFPFQDIYVMNADGSNFTQLTHFIGFADHPFYSPDGTRILFDFGAAGSPPGYGPASFDLYVMNADGSNQTQLTRTTPPPCNTTPCPLATNSDATWAPDGHHIAFVSDRAGNGNQVYVMEADGNNVKQLTNVAGGASSPSWSPDATLIAFAAGGALWLMNADGTGPVAITPVSESDVYPAFPLH